MPKSSEATRPNVAQQTKITLEIVVDSEDVAQARSLLVDTVNVIHEGTFVHRDWITEESTTGRN